MAKPELCFQVGSQAGAWEPEKHIHPKGNVLVAPAFQPVPTQAKACGYKYSPFKGTWL
jgi:hypothetical protein